MRYNKDLTLAVDLYGCPNRCRHCWLGHLPNTKPKEDADRILVDYFAPHFRSVTFYSWMREPDFCEDYQSRWEQDKNISRNAKPQRFELASFWRLARDKNYVEFLKRVGTDTVQLTFFGLKNTTDYFVGRQGAFEELMQATEILIANKIAPRWQAFLYQTNRNEIVELLHLSRKLCLEERCRAFGKQFDFFVHEGSCDGENAKLYSIRICKNDVPQELMPYYKSYAEAFSEAQLCETLAASGAYFVPHNGENIVLNVTNDFDIYFNFTHISPEWRIGNISEDNKEELLERIVSERMEPLEIARRTTIGELVAEYGNFSSQRVFSREDYLQYLLNLHVAKSLGNSDCR